MRASPTLCIDADVLRYLMAFKNTKRIQWEEDEAVCEVIDPDKARADLEGYISDLLTQFRTDKFILPLSVSTNFRKGILESYKANRVVKPKPKLWYAVDGFLKDLYPDRIVTREYLEGDDLLGLMSTCKDNPWVTGKVIVVSIDKDMQTLACNYYNPMKSELGLRKISQHDADLYWMTQALTGDTTDNYKGCPGIGPKKAEAILAGPHEKFAEASPEEHLAALWEAVVETYATKKLTVDDALVQARCARILRSGDYNYQTEEVTLWTP